MNKNFYQELELKENATQGEIKSSYRRLVKKHHPDAGGEKERFLSIQVAWETLNDPFKKEQYDKTLFSSKQSFNFNNDNWKEKVNLNKYSSITKDNEVKDWIKTIYNPTNRFISQIIKPLSQEIKELAADPYDEELMDNFCHYINLSQKKMEKVDKLYKSASVPNSISSLGLDLYHCFSQVKDALSELEKYTQGYVDDYLFDGKEMMKEAKRIQLKMANDKKSIIS